MWSGHFKWKLEGVEKLEHIHDVKGKDCLLLIQKHDEPYNLLLKNSVYTLNN